MNETTIHANEMVRAIRDQLYTETESMTPEQFMAFIASESSKRKLEAARRAEAPEE